MTDAVASFPCFEMTKSGENGEALIIISGGIHSFHR
jgi:hypothetical protein